MGVNSQVLKKINSDMEKPEFFSFNGFELAIFTGKGSRPKGEKNEDSCGFMSPTPSQLALVVSDGLGGHKFGDKASKIVVNTTLGRNSGRRRPFKSSEIINKLEKAHQKIIDLKSDAGATVVAAIVEGKNLWFYSVGDSLGFLLSKNGEISYKTFEHSVVGFATESGLLAEKEAQGHDQSNIILNALGFVDSRMESSFRLEIGSENILVLCTDGLTDLLTVDQITSFLIENDLKEGIPQMIDKALSLQKERGEFDDLTFIVCKVD